MLPHIINQQVDPFAKLPQAVVGFGLAPANQQAVAAKQATD